MSQLAINCNGNYINKIPPELILKIIYTHKGIEHKNSKIIKDYIKSYNSLKICWICRKDIKKVSLSKVNKSYICHNNLIELQNYILQTQNPKKIYMCFSCAH